ncbi:MAG: VOC family protein [Calditrichaeota bacterium]|nr:VOC family protein [Calditrichota bacterium]
MAQHAFCHVEWHVSDLERAKGFYSRLFGWSFEAYGDDYLMFQTPSRELGGGLFRTSDPVKSGASPLVYINVDDIEGYLNRAVQFGGAVQMPKMPIGEMGWMAILTDPDGNAIGLYKSANPDFDSAKYPLNAFCHVEWQTKDLAGTRAFFEGLFGWRFENTFMETYQTYMTPSEEVGGGIGLADTVQAAASPGVYIEVNEIEDYLSKAIAAGASVAVPKTEIPGHGWFAHLQAPDGNTVGLFQSGHGQG